MTSKLPITHRDGMYSVMLRSCTCGVLAHLLDRSIPFIWIRRHWPHRYVQWFRARVPLSGLGQPRDVEVRSLEFELQLQTERFLELLPEFEEHGMDLCQMTQRVPDTLTLQGVADTAVARILIANGLHLRFILPHAGECAQLASPHREVVETTLRSPEVAALAYGSD